jgi:hypothetical protein
VGKATVSVQVNSGNVIGDDLWLWRADHTYGVGWTSNTAQNGLVVNGTNVTMYGLAVEHYQQYSVLWNGNGGRTYFFQNELPYDVPNQSSWMNGSTRGYAAYKVASTVTPHGPGLLPLGEPRGGHTGVPGTAPRRARDAITSAGWNGPSTPNGWPGRSTTGWPG